MKKYEVMYSEGGVLLAISLVLFFFEAIDLLQISIYPLFAVLGVVVMCSGLEWRIEELEAKK